MRVISTRIHGVIDLAIAALLIFSPFIFNFVSLGGPAVVIPIVLGIVLASYSALTNDEEGVLRVINMPAHMMLDIILAAGLMLSPYLFNFADGPLYTWLPHVLLGISLIIVAMVSNTIPYIHRHHHRFPRSVL